MAACVASAATMSAQGRSDLVWIVGDAVSYGWSLDDATAIEATAENDKVYTGTIYLQADKDFKFLSTYDWDNLEYRPAEPNATPAADGKIAMQAFTGNDNDNKIHVTESANYFITLDIESMQATIVKSEYQETEIACASLFVVGGATPGGWSVDQGLALAQDIAKPYVFTGKGLDLVNGYFKIATVLKGGGTWDAKYWIFRDADDAGKIAPGVGEGDNQWPIENDGKYDITVDLIAKTISITGTSGIEDIAADITEGEATYYTIDGRRIVNPDHGTIVIRVAADGKASKIRF